MHFKILLKVAWNNNYLICHTCVHLILKYYCTVIFFFDIMLFRRYFDVWHCAFVLYTKDVLTSCLLFDQVSLVISTPVCTYIIVFRLLFIWKQWHFHVFPLSWPMVIGYVYILETVMFCLTCDTCLHQNELYLNKK